MKLEITEMPKAQATAHNITLCICILERRRVFLVHVSVHIFPAGPWYSSAAATDTLAGGVRASRASWGATGRLSSETTASDRSRRNRKTSPPNGNFFPSLW